MFAKLIQERVDAYDKLVAEGLAKPMELITSPEFVVDPNGFSMNGKLEFKFTEEILIPAELEGVALRTSTLGPGIK